MSDHIEAIRRYLVKYVHLDEYWGTESLITQTAHDVWAAGVEALIAHKPCGGTNTVCPMGETFGECSHPLVQMDACDGPHTVIVKGDGTKLYADKGPPADVLIMYLRRAGGWPSDWRIE